MNRKGILDLLEASPFIPFRLHLTDGKTYDIEHPDFVWVHPTRLLIIRPAEPDNPRSRSVEQAHYVGLLHIVRIEPLKQAA